MKILVFGIHPDDIELGCGGSVALAARQGHDVTLVDLTPGEASSNGTPEERAGEARRAAEILGAGRRINLGLPDSAIQSENPDQTRTVVDAIRRARPGLIIVPYKNDPHPDHASGGALIERAIYLAGIHGYETGTEACSVRKALVYRGRLEFDPDFIVDISSTFTIKEEAIKAHRTQFIMEKGRKPTPINSADFLPMLRENSRSYGYRIGVQYGEPFRSLQPAALNDFTIFES